MGCVVFLAIGAVIAFGIFNYLAPSKERVNLNDIYNVPQGEVKLFIDDEMWETNGICIDDKLYVDYETIKKKLTENIYYDENEKLLIVTTADENIVAVPDSMIAEFISFDADLNNTLD